MKQPNGDRSPLTIHHSSFIIHHSPSTVFLHGLFVENRLRCDIFLEFFVIYFIASMVGNEKILNITAMA
jgi:hypothetical protein